MSGLNAFALNVEAEETGIWIPVNDMKFLIAKAGNDSWKAENKKLERQTYGFNARKKDKRDTEKDVQIMLRCLATTSVLDWTGVKLDGKEIKYSASKSLEILTDKRFRPLAEMLLDFAMDEERFMEEEIKEDEETAKK